MPSEPAYVVALKALSKSTSMPSISALREMEKEFYGESDRACGILLGEWVGSALERAIRSILRPDLSNNLAKRLFEFEGPIGTFASKIDFGFALSIYGRKTNHDLGLVRLIRNEFAHCRLPLRFQMAEVTHVCSHLQLPEWEHSASAFSFRSLPGMAEAMETEKWWDDKKNPKTRFVIVCHTIAEELFKFARAHRETLRMSALP
jgi:hypothetical protein